MCGSCFRFFCVLLAYTASPLSFCFFFTDPATTEIYTLSLHDALPIFGTFTSSDFNHGRSRLFPRSADLYLIEEKRSEEHTSELQSLRHLVCRLLLEKKKSNSRSSRARREGSSMM